MAKRQMNGDNRERRKQASEAREAGKDASETGATTGGEKQRTAASRSMSHQEKIDLQREGKHDVISENTPEARPGSRDEDSLDRERHPRR